MSGDRGVGAFPHQGFSENRNSTNRPKAKMSSDGNIFNLHAKASHIQYISCKQSIKNFLPYSYSCVEPPESIESNILRWCIVPGAVEIGCSNIFQAAKAKISLA